MDIHVPKIGNLEVSEILGKHRLCLYSYRMTIVEVHFYNIYIIIYMIIYGRMMLKNNMMINDLHEVIYLCSLLLNE